ncbi:MAG: UDP-4-amino-4,6-dideoxy-N-acetyl-beta-L-altrosamine transaminase [Candidatus Pacebacteria bacterium]|nr:UDP-4-amino-4,6-dideoxy-N-acetyl-beta-L-altrosamine transaminase [Candidatus Paceibacterota bacterium]
MANEKTIIPYGKQWIDDDDIQEVVDVLKSDWLTCGPKVDEFEKAIANYCNAKYAVAFSSGTAALHGAYFVLGIKQGDEVVVPPLTFSATANGVVYCGGKPVFSDINPNTLNIDSSKIEEKITPKTKAIAIVDFAGQPCDFDAIKQIAQKHNLPIMEDAAHALGSLYKDQKIGSLADLTVFSFHPVKTITSGEGGMVLTNSQDFYEKLKIFRHHGIVKKPEDGPWYYEIEELGYNYRLTDIHCALGLSQLKKLDKFIARRREIVKKYQEAFGNVPEIILIKEESFAKSAWHIYPVQFDLTKLKIGRQEIFEQLGQKGIKCQVHYVPVHYMPFYQKKFGYKKGDFPITEQYYERAITLPLFSKLTDEEVDYVIATVKQIINVNRKI